MVNQIKQQVPAAEFERLQEESTDRIELINGEVAVSPPPIPLHQGVQFWVSFTLGKLLPVTGGRIFTAPIEVYLDENNRPQPDVVWIAPDSKCIIGEKNLIGAPDLLIEIASPSTARYDKKVKFELYERFGVREYWLADPADQLLEVWVLTERKFLRQGIYEPGDTFASPVLSGQTIDLSAIFTT